MQRGFYDASVPAAPVVTVAGPQPHGLALPLNDQAEAIVFDLVKPLRSVRNLGSVRLNAGVESGFAHSGKIGRLPKIASPKAAPARTTPLRPLLRSSAENGGGNRFENRSSR